jgi:hypothetical protein
MQFGRYALAAVTYNRPKRYCSLLYSWRRCKLRLLSVMLDLPMQQAVVYLIPSMKKSRKVTLKMFDHAFFML